MPLSANKMFTVALPFLFGRIVEALNFNPATAIGTPDRNSDSHPLLLKAENGSSAKGNSK